MSEVLLHTKLRELEEELKVEREVRIRYEKELANLKLDVDDLDVQLEESKTAKEREIEASKRLRQEIADLKQKIDSQNNENEESAALLRRKHQETVAELSNHLESISKSKLKYEKEAKTFLHQIEDLRNEIDSLSKSRASALSNSRELENKQVESAQRIDELLRQLAEINDLKNRIANQNAEYHRKNASLDFELQQLNVANKRLSQELDDAKMQLENEILVRNSLESKSRNLQLDLDAVNGHLEEETEAKLELQKQINKLQEEFKAARDRIDKECEAKIEEAEDSKRRLNNRYLELQDQYTDVLSKSSNHEKAKLRLQAQNDSLTTDLDKFKKRSEELTKREKVLEKDIEEFKNKLSSANAELDAAYQASRNHALELSKYKHLNEQFAEQLDSVQKDKRRLSEELEVTSNQLLESQGKLAEFERRLKTAEAERQQLQNDLDDSRDALQMEINRNQNLQAQYEKLKIDTDKRLSDKEEEVDALRTSHRRQLETMQNQLEETESRHKADLANLKKKYLLELDDLRSKLDVSKRARLDAENNFKRLQQANKEALDKLTEEQHLHDATRDQLSNAVKSASSYRAELEEVKALYERVDKAKKTLEFEYHDLEEKLNETQSALNRAIAERKKFEADAVSASDELHEVKFELKNAEERVRNVNAALVKKDEDIRHEKEVAAEIDASRKAIEQQLRETQARIEEAEEFAKREAKRLASKLEARIVQLETDLDLLRTKEQEYIKELRRLEKRNKELMDQVNDEQTKLLSMTDAYDKLQDKMKKYKGQIEGAEEQMAVNISKCKRLQRELEDAEDRAEAIAKTFLRGSSVSRNTENYDSDSENYQNASVNTPSFLRASYLYSKPTNIDDYSSGVSTSTPFAFSRQPSVGSWRSKYKTVDIDDDDISIQPRYSKYSGYNNSSSYELKSKPWSSNRSYRAKSVASLFDYDSKTPTITIGGTSATNNIYASRSSVSRYHDDLNDSADAYSSSKPNVSQTFKNIEKKADRLSSARYNNRSPNLDSHFKKSDIEKRISKEHSITPTPEILD